MTKISYEQVVELRRGYFPMREEPARPDSDDRRGKAGRARNDRSDEQRQKCGGGWRVVRKPVGSGN